MFLKKIFKKIIDYKKSSVWRNSITLYPPRNLFSEKDYKGFVLLSYLTAPFYKKINDPVFKTHTNHWECIQIANTFLELGYVVDVIIFSNKEFLPKKDYRVFIDLGYNLERMSLILNKNCIKVMHITEAHWLFNNLSEYKRLTDLLERKKTALLSRKISESNKGIEFADIATVLGNEFTSGTYAFAKKKIYLIPISNSFFFDFPSSKDFDKVRRKYLWFGSIGLVHRGLDLVLEAFSKMSDYELFVCGPVDDEADFKKLYFKELYETPNIKTVGWVDVASKEFLEILKSCIGIVYPSCSEGGGGSVITCMHAGLIPVVSYEASVNVEDFGFILKENNIEEIKNTVSRLSNANLNEIRDRSYKSWQYARSNHTREKFAITYRHFVKEILKL